MSKITAIHGGGDWTDASADYVILQPGVRIEAEKAAWKTWYRDIYCTNLGSWRLDRSVPRIEFMDLAEFCVSRGARRPTEDELAVFVDV